MPEYADDATGQLVARVDSAGARLEGTYDGRVA